MLWLKVKIIAACVALAAAFATIPGWLQSEIRVLGVLIILDLVSGVWLAIVRRQLRSHTMRIQFVSKVLLYGLIIGIGRCMGIMGGTWFLDGAFVGACIGIEITSNIENVTRLAEAAGVKLPEPTMRFLMAVGGVFAHAHGAHESAEPSVHG